MCQLIYNESGVFPRGHKANSVRNYENKRVKSCAYLTLKGAIGLALEI